MDEIESPILKYFTLAEVLDAGYNQKGFSGSDGKGPDALGCKPHDYEDVKLYETMKQRAFTFHLVEVLPRATQ